MGEWMRTAVRRTGMTLVAAGGVLSWISCGGDNVTGPTTGSQIAFSRFFRNDVSGVYRLYIVNADGTGQMQLAPDASLPAWSPDGSKIAFQSGGDIYVANGDGTSPSRLTNRTWDIVFQVLWSPDGSRIAFETFCCKSTGESSSDIRVVRADGSGQIRVVPHAQYGAWSPDGHKIAFSSAGQPGRTGINIIDLDGGGVTLLAADATTGVPAWSPDGGRIAFSGGTDTTCKIEIMNPDGTGRATLMSGAGGILQTLAWSPDGTMIAFGTNRSGSWDVWTMRADGSGQTNLTNDAASEFEPSWSPDGRRIAFVRLLSTGAGEIYLVNADGTGLINVSHPPNGSSDHGPSWRPKR